MGRLRAGKAELEHFKGFMEERIGLEEDVGKRMCKLVARHQENLYSHAALSYTR